MLLAEDFHYKKIVKFAEKVKCYRSQSRDFQLSLLAIVQLRDILQGATLQLILRIKMPRRENRRDVTKLSFTIVMVNIL